MASLFRPGGSVPRRNGETSAKLHHGSGGEKVMVF